MKKVYYIKYGLQDGLSSPSNKILKLMKEKIQNIFILIKGNIFLLLIQQ